MLSNCLFIGINTCLHCGSFGFRSSLLCFYCEGLLFKTALNSGYFKSEVRKIPTRALFLWQPDRNRILNRVSLGLKGTGQKQAWAFYAEMFLNEWEKSDSPDPRAVFVPCPSKAGEQDHAYLFASALSALTKIPVRGVLERVDAKEQKILSRREREQSVRSKFRLCSITSEKFSQVYFVDDIITTGATLSGASSHLKKIGPVKGISLIIRE